MLQTGLTLNCFVSNQTFIFQSGFIDYVLAKLWDPMSMMFKELRPCYNNLLKNRKFYEQRWKTGKSGAPLPPPQPIVKIQRRGSLGNPRTPNTSKYMGNSVTTMVQVNRARKKFVGYAQKRGTPARADRPVLHPNRESRRHVVNNLLQ